MDTQSSGAGMMQQSCPAGAGEWAACWDVIEALARDSARWMDKCGSNFSMSELAEWRQRVLAQVHQMLDEEAEAFGKMEAEEKT